MLNRLRTTGYCLYLARCLLLSCLLSTPTQAETIPYQHDDAGNLTQIGTTTYTYDALNRLKTETPQGKATLNYNYDENGNRIQDNSGSYTYDTTSNRMLTRRGLSVTLDAIGNLTLDGTGREYSYNQAGQLAQVKQNGVLIASYLYDYRGLRISKTTTASAPQGAQTVIYDYDQQGHLITEYSGSGTALRTYVWRDDTPIAQIEHQPSRKIYYFETDHLNTPRVITDESARVVWRWNSDAFGSTLPDEDPDKDGIKVTSNLRFPGQYYDRETGLHYNWHRYYDPSMGQYIQADPVGLAAGNNLYAYVGGNPLSFVDFFGLAGGPPARGTYYPRGTVPSGRPRPATNDSTAKLFDDLSNLIDPPSNESARFYPPDRTEKICIKWICPNPPGQCPEYTIVNGPIVHSPGNNPCTCIEEKIITTPVDNHGRPRKK